MLKLRVITALILAAVLLSALFLLSLQHFAWVLGILFVIGAWEWANFARLRPLWRVVYAILVMGAMIALWQWLGLGRVSFGLRDKLQTVLIVTVVFWGVAIFWITTYPTTVRQWSGKPVQLLMGLVVLVPAWVSLVFLSAQPHGVWLIIIAAAVVVCADTGAYFTGRKWGKNKLAAAVSPGKTLEGVYGGMGLSLLFALIVAFGFGRGTDDGWLVLMVVASSVISVFGDLLESMLKRNRGIKDSGVVLPGHGGVLDRIDSITAAAPVFTLVYLLCGWSW